MFGHCKTQKCDETLKGSLFPVIQCAFFEFYSPKNANGSHSDSQNIGFMLAMEGGPFFLTGSVYVYIYTLT